MTLAPWSRSDLVAAARAAGLSRPASASRGELAGAVLAASPRNVAGIPTVETASRLELLVAARNAKIPRRYLLSADGLRAEVALASFSGTGDLARGLRGYASITESRRAYARAAHLDFAGVTPGWVWENMGGADAGFVPCVSCGRKTHETVASSRNRAGLEAFIVTAAGPRCRSCAAAAAGLYPSARPELRARNGDPVTGVALGADRSLRHIGVTGDRLPPNVNLSGFLAVLHVDTPRHWAYSIGGQSTDPATVRAR